MIVTRVRQQLSPQVAEQAKTISALQQQLRCLSVILASAAQSIAEPVPVEEENSAVEITNGLCTDRQG